jgi:tetrapyrrole methylase family protein / MazG family protein
MRRGAEASPSKGRTSKIKMKKSELAKAFLDLKDLVGKLRGPGGCPWDARQTEETLKTYLLEEAYEVVDAINRGVPEDVCHELGDLLFQIFFLATIAAEKGQFDLLRVIKDITAKMIHRHPHVFGDAKVANAEEVAEKWEKIKKEERNLSAASPKLMEDVPSNLPALLRAHRLMERGARLRPVEPDIWAQVQEVFNDLSKSLVDDEREKMGMKIGDLLFTLAGLCRQNGLNAEHVLREANERYLEEFRKRGGSEGE